MSLTQPLTFFWLGREAFFWFFGPEFKIAREWQGFEGRARDPWTQQQLGRIGGQTVAPTPWVEDISIEDVSPWPIGAPRPGWQSMRRRAPWQGQGGPAQRVRKTGFVAGGGKMAFAVPRATRVPWRRGGRGVLTGGQRLRRNIRVGGFTGIEFKFLDCAWNGVVLASSNAAAGGELQPSTGCTNAISVPAQGDGESERDGRRYDLKSAYVTGTIDFSPLANQADASQGGAYFLALVLDTQANAATVVSENVFTNPGTTTNTGVTPLRNLQHSSRYRVLDSVIMEDINVVTQTDGTNTGSHIPAQQHVFKLGWRGDLRVECSGTTADVASVTNNALHLVGFAANTVYTPVIRAVSRCRFVG